MILASHSPRRRELLAMLGLQFTCRTSQADETMDAALSPEEAVAAVCRRKAQAVSQDVPQELVVAADTIVVVDGAILGKPASPQEAKAMLQSLSGRDHQVFTGVCLRRGQEEETFVERTDLTFRPLTSREIDAYVATGSPMDKAGAYGIQDQAGCFVQSLRGDYYNVMGLPLCALTQRLRRWGIAVLGETGGTNET